MNESWRNNQIEEINLDSGNFDLRIIFRNIFLNKKLIAIITFTSVAISLFYSFSKEKIYKGSFQIVLKDSTNNKDSLSSIFQNNAFSSSISNLVKSRMAKDLNTQVEILKSPSVLMPIFEYVKSEKLKGKKYIPQYRFEKWIKKSLAIELLSGTTVLKIEYFDNDKDLILKALDKISKKYQMYSDNERITGLESGIKYLENQIQIYKKNSQTSFSEFQKFATENNMNTFFIGEINSKEDFSSLIDAQSGIQKDSELRKKIKTLDFYISNLENQKNKDFNFELARGIASNMDENNNNNNKFLEEIDLAYQKLIEAKSNFTENDLAVIELQSKIDFLKSEFLVNFLEELKASKSVSSLKLQSNLKPDSTYLKYKELARKSIRDDLTLQNLEQQKLILSLEQAKSSKPWELITEPTVLLKPIGAAKRTILFSGFLIGLFISTLTIYLKDRIKDNVYSSKELIKDINIGFQLDIQLQEEKKLKETIKILSSRLSQKEKISDLGLFIVGDVSSEDINKLVSNINFENKFEIIISKDLLEIEKLENKLIVLSPGNITRNELKTLKQNINFQEISFLGALIINLEKFTISDIFQKN